VNARMEVLYESSALLFSLGAARNSRSIRDLNSLKQEVSPFQDSEVLDRYMNFFVNSYAIIVLYCFVSGICFSAAVVLD
jgi:hypothetical protein